MEAPLSSRIVPLMLSAPSGPVRLPCSNAMSRTRVRLVGVLVGGVDTSVGVGVAAASDVGVAVGIGTSALSVSVALRTTAHQLRIPGGTCDDLARRVGWCC